MPARGVIVVKLSSTLYAVPFYQALSYQRSTGVRVGRSFQGSGLPYQPMKKVLGVSERPRGNPSVTVSRRIRRVRPQPAAGRFFSLPLRTCG